LQKQTDRTEQGQDSSAEKQKSWHQTDHYRNRGEELHAKFSVRVEKGFYFLGIVVIMCIYLDQNHFV
jgi:hypothetical protein